MDERDLVEETIEQGSEQPTSTATFRSEYDGRYYRDRIEATQRMLGVECGATSRIAAEAWLDREDDARNNRERW
jgi:hypothetical protein